MILKYIDESIPTDSIVGLLDTSRPTISQVKKRYLCAGLQSALCEQPRPGQPIRIGQKEEAHVTTLACSDPPEGRKHWTIRLLQDRVIELGYVEAISRESVRKILKKAYLSLG